MAARSQPHSVPRRGSRALAHYLPRPLYPAWIQGLEGDRLLGVHRRDPDPTRSDLARSRCRARGVAPSCELDRARSPTGGGCKHEFVKERSRRQAGVYGRPRNSTKVTNFVSWRVTARGRLRSGIATRGRSLVGSDRV
jgi:hypothetical protein